ncbi:MAG TPA: trypsin-like peptidase domain-containing protein [Planctomycetaceae bacterium]|nr:trypsin-like peptidase domain-containing protein [Planctomycetaceae bacterium]
MVPLKLLFVSLLGWSGNLDGVVLDFTATWCGPCQEMSPIVSRLERLGYPIRRVDFDAHRDLARKFHVERIPTFVLVIDGEEQARIQGRVSEDALKKLCARIPQNQDVAATGDKQTADSNRLKARSETEPAAQTQTTALEPSAPAKSGFKLPFFGGKKDEPPRDLSEGAIPRGNYDDKQESRPAGKGNPLAASVRIRVKDPQGENFGSGTVIDSRVGRTTILTCGHIFRNWDKQSTIEVDYFTGGRVQTVVGRRLYHDLDDDVGLIIVNVDALPSCRVAPPETKILKGSPVVTVGCSAGDKPTVQSLKITALNRYLGADNIEVSGLPAQGRSGGGLFTKDGRLIGVCSGADSHYNEGLYVGLKAVHALLERCQLPQFYRSVTPGEKVPLLADSRSAARENQQQAAVALELKNDQPVASATQPGEKVFTTKTQPRSPKAAPGTVDADSGNEGAIDEALEQAGEAEIVCIIRPIHQPRAASRVVILNRASRRFVEYLSDEVDSPQDLRETTLLAKDRSPRPAATQSAKRPATSDRDAQMIGSDAARPRAAGPQPYRRKRLDRT